MGEVWWLLCKLHRHRSSLPLWMCTCLNISAVHIIFVRMFIAYKAGGGVRTFEPPSFDQHNHLMAQLLVELLNLNRHLACMNDWIESVLVSNWAIAWLWFPASEPVTAFDWNTSSVTAETPNSSCIIIAYEIQDESTSLTRMTRIICFTVSPEEWKRKY